MHKSCLFIKYNCTNNFKGGENMGAKSKKNLQAVEWLDADETEAEEGFFEGDISFDDAIAVFNFSSDEKPIEATVPVLDTPIQDKQPQDSQPKEEVYCSSSPRGLTPPVNGEHYTVKRSYQMRPSTVKKLNRLKALHPDVNILFNSIVDMAISHYYHHIVNENGVFSLQEEKKKNS
jgi:hypothetical protein